MDYYTGGGWEGVTNIHTTQAEVYVVCKVIDSRAEATFPERRQVRKGSITGCWGGDR